MADEIHTHKHSSDDTGNKEQKTRHEATARSGLPTESVIDTELSESFLQDILQASPVAIGLAQDRYLKWVNDSFLTMFAAADRSLYVGSETRVIYESDEEFERVGRALYSGSGYLNTGHTDARFKRQDGTVFDGHISIKPFERDGRSLGHIAAIADVSIRKQDERSLREREERFRALSESSLTGICLHQDSRFVYVNDRFAEILGYDREELIGMPYWETVHPDDCEMVMSYARARQNGRTAPDSYTFRAVTKDRQVRWLEIWAHAIEHEGRSAVLANLIDITHRKNTEQALRQSEEKYRRMFDHAPVGVLHFDAGGILRDCNENLVSIIGSSKESLVGLDLIYDLEDEQVIRAVTQTLSGGVGRFEGEYYSVTAPKVTPVKAVFSPLLDADGSVAGGIGIVEDITDRRRADDEVKKAQAMLLAAIEQSPAGILIADAPDVRIRIANSAALGIRGDTSSPLTGIPMDLHPTNWQSYKPDGTPFKPEELPLSRAILEGRVSRNVDVIIKRPDGDERWVLANAAPVRDASGEVVSGVVVFSDITKRKRAEEALRQSRKEYMTLYEESKKSEEMYRSLLDSSPDPVVVYDMQGHVQYVNNRFSEVFGWTLQELRGGRIPFLPAEERTETMRIINEVLFEGIPCSGFETARYTKDGRLLDIRISAARYRDHEDNPAGMLVVLRDVTERKKLEEQLQQAAKMEAIGRLAGGIAHDFNNLLTAMIGYSNMLLEAMPEESPQRTKILQMQGAAERAAMLTRQLLAFGRKQFLDMRVLDLNAVISDFGAMLKRLIGEDIQTVMVLNPKIGKIKADRSQVEQILMNLAVNARDAMPKGGRLTIETTDVVLDDAYARRFPEVKPGNYVMFSVRDTGRGMDEEIMSRMFEPFFTTKEQGSGTGLGLATVYGIVKQHRGHIAVESRLREGALFRVYFERVADHAEESLPATVPDAPAGGGVETVLVVEDEAIVRELVCEVLRSMGYNVLKAARPGRALELSESYSDPIHLLLTDVVMPEMDGKSLFEKLSPGRPEMRVLYVSGYTEESIVTQGILNSHVCFLQKPFTAAKLASKVRNVLDHSPGSSDS